MSDVLTPRQRKDRLFAWRDTMEALGVAMAELPLKSDLETVAKRQFENGDQLAQLLLTRKELVVEWADHLLWVLNASADDDSLLPPWGRAPKAAPDVPAQSKSNGRAASSKPRRAPSNGSQSQAPTGDVPTSLSFAVTDSDTRFVARNQAKARLMDDVTQIYWPARADAAAVLYRVTARAYYRPHNPDRSEAVAVTKAPQCEDENPGTAAIRHVAIWTYCGPNDTAAAASQPELWAEIALVAPPQDVLVRERNGQVAGSWQVRDGIERVNVFRIPVDQARDIDTYPIEHQICTDSDNLTGFVDTTAPAGKTYEYRFEAIAEVSDQGDEGSVMVAHEVDVVGSLKAVTDLQIETRDDGYYLSWTAPLLRRSQVYQTESEPKAGVDDLLDVDALPQAGLCVEQQLAMPTTRLGQRLTTGPLSNPREWSRTHYSLAVIARTRAIVGPSVAVARVARIADAEILERVDHQLIVFDWPGEAAQVSIHVAAPNAPAPILRGQPAYATLTRKDFDARGGLVLGRGGEAGTGRALNRPCRVFLVPEFYEMGRIVPSEPIACDYPGLVRIMYRFEATRASRRTPSSIRLLAASEFSSPPLVLTLVCRPDRLPLHREDGTVLAQMRQILVPSFEQVWTLNEPRTGLGFARLFVYQDPGAPRIAVLDPPLAGLRLP